MWYNYQSGLYNSKRSYSTEAHVAAHLLCLHKLLTLFPKKHVDQPSVFKMTEKTKLTTVRTPNSTALTILQTNKIISSTHSEDSNNIVTKSVLVRLSNHYTILAEYQGDDPLSYTYLSLLWERWPTRRCFDLYKFLINRHGFCLGWKDDVWTHL